MTCDTDRLFGLGADGWVAVFTLVLAASTIGLWFASLRASKEAKLQHMVSNRAFAYLSGFEAVKLFDQLGNLAFYRLTPNWRNSGNTPTSNALISTNWSPSPGGPPPDFSYGDDAQATFIGPGAEVGSKFIDVPAHVIEQAAKGIERIFIWGTIEYRDIFEGTPPRFTNFCFHMDVRADPHTDDRWIGYVPHVGHNDTDLDRRKIKAPEGVFQSWIAGIVDVKQPH